MVINGMRSLFVKIAENIYLGDGDIKADEFSKEVLLSISRM